MNEELLHSALAPMKVNCQFIKAHLLDPVALIFFLYPASVERHLIFLELLVTGGYLFIQHGNL